MTVFDLTGWLKHHHDAKLFIDRVFCQLFSGLSTEIVDNFGAKGGGDTELLRARSRRGQGAHNGVATVLASP